MKPILRFHCTAKLCIRINSVLFLSLISIGASSVVQSQTLHELVALASPGDTIVLGPQIYTIDQTLLIDKPLTIVGQGRDNTLIQASASMTADRLFNVVNTSNVRLADFTLDAMSLPSVENAIVLGYGSDHTLEDLRIRNIQATTFGLLHGIYAPIDVTNSVFAHNEILNIGENSRWGAGIRLSNGSGGNLIDGNFISDVGRGGILLNDGSRDTRIVRNVVQNIGLLEPGDPSLRLGIEVFGSGLHRIEDNRNVIIEDNQLDHWLSVSTQADVAVRRNIISGPHVGSGIGFSGLEVVTLQRAIFTDNVVQGGQHLGISSSGAGAEDLIFWSKNSIQNAETFGTQVQGEAGGASRMYFYDNVFANSRNTSNSWITPAGQALRFNNNASRIVLDKNQFLNNDGAAIQLIGSNLDQFVVINNTITGNDRAVLGSFPGANLHWANNSVAGNNINNSLVSKGFTGGPPPSPSIELSGNSVVGNVLNLQLVGMDSLTLSEVLWDFGEGLPVTGEQVQHAYSKKGEYIVSAITWTDSGWGVLAQKALTIVPGLGDFDEDGDVDGLDFLYWQRDPTIGNLSGWQANYGIGGNLSTATESIPEPDTCVMLLTCLLLGASRCRISLGLLCILAISPTWQMHISSQPLNLSTKV